MNEMQRTAARIKLLNAVSFAQLAYDCAKDVDSADKATRKSELRIAKLALRVFDSAING